MDSQVGGEDENITVFDLVYRGRERKTIEKLGYRGSVRSPKIISPANVSNQQPRQRSLGTTAARPFFPAST